MRTERGITMEKSTKQSKNRRRNTRIALLAVERVIVTETSPDNPISTNEIIECAEQFGVLLERKSVYRDIKALKKFYPIRYKYGLGGGWYLDKQCVNKPIDTGFTNML